jgi:hypothetical protein
MMLKASSDQKFDWIDPNETRETKTIQDILSILTEIINIFNSNVYTFTAIDVEFEYFRSKWITERGATSSITEMVLCPSYQCIIAKGPIVIPLILRQMEREGDEPDMWFWALRVLTNANPILESDQGNIVKMAKSWLKWARGRYVW